jgi:hypothetical protein
MTLMMMTTKTMTLMMMMTKMMTLIKTILRKAMGCFITTAVCDFLSEPDDCYELTLFRSFRDNWLSFQPDGKQLVEQYYDILLFK